MEKDIGNTDCCLLFDGMSIKKNILFDKEKGCYEGFTDYGKDIICSSPDEIASETVVLMLVGLRKHRKYPVGYILCVKMNAENQHCLISQSGIGLSRFT